MKWHASRPALLAALAGLIVFSLLVDPSVIDPFRTGWLATGDPAQSYLGWLFFRQEPWSLPLGAAHSMGMEQASSIVYSDSIPLLAFSFKLIRSWLPANFQYAGMWLFACYALQGYFACRLLALFTSRKSVLAAGVLLFLLSPIMLFRAPAHLALTAHWIVLAAIYLYYAAPERLRLLQWLLLLWLAPLVHAYLMFMAYAIWAAYLFRHGVLDRCWSGARLLVLVIGAAAGSLMVMWLAGYFMDMEVSAGGFGYYSMNLLAPLLPIGAGPFLLHAPLAATSGQYEGFNYLGLGVLLALFAAAVSTLDRWRHQPPAEVGTWRRMPDLALILCCLVLTVLAVSTTVTLGSHVLFSVALPAAIDRALNVFRASGRLFWPVYYVLLLSAMRGLTRLSGPICRRLLVLVVLIQLVDVWPYLHAMRDASVAKVAHDHFPVFPSSFWAQARARYPNIYVIPGKYEENERVAYESLAVRYGFSIDTAYYARLPAAAHQVARQQRHELFYQGVLDPHGLYLIQAAASVGVGSAQRLLPPTTGVGDVDGFTVVAPGWFEQGAPGYLHRPDKVDYPVVPLAQEVSFAKGGTGLAYMLTGWSEPGADATWSEQASAMLVFHVPSEAGDLQVVLEVMPYLPAAYPRLDVKVHVGGHLLADWIFERGRPAPDTTLLIPAAWRPVDGNIALAFSFDTPRSPQQSGESTDARKLALLLRKMSVQ
jgi:hypothetical protein